MILIFIPSKFKMRIKTPKSSREDEEPIDAKDIRNILLHCNDRRLLSFDISKCWNELSRVGLEKNVLGVHLRFLS
jgi:hypothetical protein